MGKWIDYPAYLKSPEWRARRLAVLERAGGVCEMCRTSQATQIHHRTYERLGREADVDLMAICSDCHRDLTGGIRWYQKQIAAGVTLEPWPEPQENSP